jgi:hypothetical protein
LSVYSKTETVHEGFPPPRIRAEESNIFPWRREKSRERKKFGWAFWDRAHLARIALCGLPEISSTLPGVILSFAVLCGRGEVVNQSGVASAFKVGFAF